MNTKRLKAWFFIKTATALKRGVRFKDDDRPTESTMSDLTASSVFSSEPGDKANEDTGGFNADKNGHVVLATDAQIKNYETKKTDRSIVVQPSQVTEVAEGTDVTAIGDYDLNGGTIHVEKSASETKRNKFLLTLKPSLASWINDFWEETTSFIAAATPKLIPDGGSTGEVLQKASDNDNDVIWGPVTDDFLTSLSYKLTESLDAEVDIVVPIDTTSLGAVRTTIITEMQKWYDAFKQANPWYQGNIYFHDDGSEQWLKWPKLYGTNYSRNKVLMVAFIDESATIYHSSTIANISTEGTTSTYRDDFNNFVVNDYPSFDYFEAILYGVPASETDTTAMFHGHIYKAVTNGTVSGYIESPTVVARGSSLSFMETTNSYANESNSNSLSGNYSGLELYGWSEYHDFATTDINTKLTAEEFDNRIQVALFGEEKTNTINVEITATMEDSSDITSNFDIDIPVAQIPFDQYKNLPNPTSAAEVTALADGTLYYLTTTQVGITPNSVLSAGDKWLFVKEA